MIYYVEIVSRYNLHSPTHGYIEMTISWTKWENKRVRLENVSILTEERPKWS